MMTNQIELFGTNKFVKISFRFVPCLETIRLAIARTSKFHKARKANCTSRKDHRREGTSKALDGSKT